MKKILFWFSLHACCIYPSQQPDIFQEFDREDGFTEVSLTRSDEGAAPCGTIPAPAQSPAQKIVRSLSATLIKAANPLSATPPANAPAQPLALTTPELNHPSETLQTPKAVNHTPRASTQTTSASSSASHITMQPLPPSAQSLPPLQIQAPQQPAPTSPAYIPSPRALTPKNNGGCLSCCGYPKKKYKV